jgi:hypothetical protein
LDAVLDDVMHDNSASQGGAIALGGSQYVHGSARLECCTLAFNRASLGGAVYVTSGLPLSLKLQFENSIVWQNRSQSGAPIWGTHSSIVVLQSDVQGGWPGTRNLDTDPLFVDPSSRDLRLRAGSRCIDAGDATLVAGDYLDLDGDLNFAEVLPRDILLARRFHDDPSMADSGVTYAGLEPLDLGAFER